MAETFTKSYIDRLRQYAQNAGQLPQDMPDGWTKSPVDVGAMVAGFDRLHIKAGYLLRAYVFRDGGNGNGHVRAMPADAPYLEPAECPADASRFLEPPVPPGALPDFRLAIDGDGSGLSYLQASILTRELCEFGAAWHGCSWSDDSILGRDPRRDPRIRESLADPSWKWIEDPGTQWRPRVTLVPTPTVVFYTFSRMGQYSIGRRTDTYQAGSYIFTTDLDTLAVGPLGSIY